MPDLSQRTLAHVMTVLESLTPEDADTYPLRQKFWQQMLFKWGFPDWLIDYAIGASHNWTAIIRDLFAGKVTQKMSGHVLYHIPQRLQESMLNRLAAMAVTESEDSEEAQQLRRSLQLDGFDVSDGKTVPIEGPVSVTQEKSRLLSNLEASSFARKELIATHVKDAEDLFSEGKMHPAMGEARSAFEAGVEDFVSLVEIKTNRKAGSGLRNQIQFLSKEGFISADEEQAFLSAWGFLSSGAHPGLPPDEAGRIGLILGLEFTQVLLIKAKNLL
jgi:hypothetical protein